MKNLLEKIKEKTLKIEGFSINEDIDIINNSNNESEIQQQLNNILYKLYLINLKDDILSFQNYFLTYELTSDKNIWTWIESSLSLLVRINKEKEDIENLERCLNKIKSAFNIGKNEMIIEVNTNARKRRQNGFLLKNDKISEAISEADNELEKEYRLSHIKELFFIDAIGNGDTITKEFIDSEIANNIHFFSSLNK
ncbi:DUF6707 family protein [Flavobacterium columnare]|uniref:Uncharacterized protein n=1 Tax=Flavobacterium columnare TaxID=996 RepID=A0AA94JQE2_9FLAO|nr:DUF6707 family protein [Flavobacterium columnare]MCH4829574.1 hypothetical protein [Flavobacterium columnare]MCH4831429.1 hypothetical protein [Flavobacterium columnare]